MFIRTYFHAILDNFENNFLHLRTSKCERIARNEFDFVIMRPRKINANILKPSLPLLMDIEIIGAQKKNKAKINNRRQPAAEGDEERRSDNRRGRRRAAKRESGDWCEGEGSRGGRGRETVLSH